MKKIRNKRALYENIMRNVAKTVKHSLTESNIASNIDGKVYDLLFDRIEHQIVTKFSIEELLSDSKFAKKIAGYLVEEMVKRAVEYSIRVDDLDIDYVNGENNWWDFSLNGEKVEIKAFQKGTLYSNVHATANQVRYKDQLTFMLVEYKIDNNLPVITGIAFVDGSDVSFDSKYNRLVRNPNIIFKRPTPELEGDWSGDWDQD